MDPIKLFNLEKANKKLVAENTELKRQMYEAGDKDTLDFLISFLATAFTARIQRVKPATEKELYKEENEFLQDFPEPEELREPIRAYLCRTRTVGCALKTLKDNPGECACGKEHASWAGENTLVCYACWVLKTSRAGVSG